MDADSYLHRVGRAGRFGTKGLAITFVSTDKDRQTLDEIQQRFEVSIGELPTVIDSNSYMNNWAAWQYRPALKSRSQNPIKDDVQPASVEVWTYQSVQQNKQIR